MGKKQTPRSKRAWAHNQLIGRTAMAITAGQAVRTSPTTTFKQRQLAIKMWLAAVELEEELRKGRAPCKGE